MAQDTQQEIRDTRDILNARLGEIITGLIGDDSIKKIYETNGPVTQASGEISERAGIVSADTKNALLIAQAAERTLRIVAKLEFFTTHKDQIMADMKQSLDDRAEESRTDMRQKNQPKGFARLRAAFQSKASRRREEMNEELMTGAARAGLERKAYEEKQVELGYLAVNDDAFRHLGSEGDPEALKTAQAVQLAAQMYLNNELESRMYKSLFPMESGVISVGDNFIGGLAGKAAALLNTAKDMLEKEGHTGAAARLAAVTSSLPAADNKGPGPVALVQRLYETEDHSVAYTNQIFSEWTLMTVAPRTGYDKESTDKLVTLINAAAPEPDVSISAAPVVKAQALKTTLS